MAAPTQQEMYTIGKAEMLALRPDLFADEGDVSDFMLSMASAMADKNVEYSTQRFNATFVDGASEDDLTTLADDHYNIQRSPSTKAAGSVSFSRPESGGTEPSGTIPIGTELATTVDAGGNDVRFVTTAAVSFSAGQLGPLSAAVEAVVAGVGGNVAAGAINRITGTISFDSTFVVTNAAVMAGGNDEESDESLRDRIRRQPQSFRRATLGALVYGALTVPAVRVASATENTTTGQVTVSVSDDSGNSNAEMVNDVLIVLEDYRAAGIPVSIVGGEVLEQDVAVTLTLADGAVASVLAPLVVAAIEAVINKLKIGQTLYDSMIITAARNVDPDSILDVTVTNPVGDVVPLSNQLIRPGTVTAA